MVRARCCSPLKAVCNMVCGPNRRGFIALRWASMVFAAVGVHAVGTVAKAATCGDYVVARGSHGGVDSSNQHSAIASELAQKHHAEMPEQSPCPCRGPQCSRVPLPVAPVSTTQMPPSSDFALLFELIWEGNAGCRRQALELAPTTLIAATSFVFRPPISR